MTNDKDRPKIKNFRNGYTRLSVKGCKIPVKLPEQCRFREWSLWQGIPLPEGLAAGYFFSFDQESFNATVRLKTSLPGPESGSTLK